MKRMKALREMPRDDIKKKIYESKLELSKEKGASVIGTVKNPGRIRSIRKNIARMLTVNRENERKNENVKSSAAARKKTEKR